MTVLLGVSEGLKTRRILESKFDVMQFIYYNSLFLFKMLD